MSFVALALYLLGGSTVFIGATSTHDGTPPLNQSLALTGAAFWPLISLYRVFRWLSE